MDAVGNNLVMRHVLRVNCAASGAGASPRQPPQVKLLPKLPPHEPTADVVLISTTHRAHPAKLAVNGGGVKEPHLPPHMKAQRPKRLAVMGGVDLSLPMLPAHLVNGAVNGDGVKTSVQ
jgi:hypothetical protein